MLQSASRNGWIGARPWCASPAPCGRWRKRNAARPVCSTHGEPRFPTQSDDASLAELAGAPRDAATAAAAGTSPPSATASAHGATHAAAGTSGDAAAAASSGAPAGGAAAAASAPLRELYAELRRSGRFAVIDKELREDDVGEFFLSEGDDGKGLLRRRLLAIHDGGRCAACHRQRHARGPPHWQRRSRTFSLRSLPRARHGRSPV